MFCSFIRRKESANPPSFSLHYIPPPSNISSTPAIESKLFFTKSFHELFHYIKSIFFTRIFPIKRCFEEKDYLMNNTSSTIGNLNSKNIFGKSENSFKIVMNDSTSDTSKSENFKRRKKVLSKLKFIKIKNVSLENTHSSEQIIRKEMENYVLPKSNYSGKRNNQKFENNSKFLPSQTSGRLFTICRKIIGHFVRLIINLNDYKEKKLVITKIQNRKSFGLSSIEQKTNTERMMNSFDENEKILREKSSIICSIKNSSNNTSWDQKVSKVSKNNFTSLLSSIFSGLPLSFYVYMLSYVHYFSPQKEAVIVCVKNGIQTYKKINHASLNLTIVPLDEHHYLNKITTSIYHSEYSKIVSIKNLTEILPCYLVQALSPLQDYRIKGVYQKTLFLLLVVSFLFYCYFRIYHLVRKRGTQLNSLSKGYSGKRGPRLKQELTILKTVIAVFLFFVLNHLPVSLLQGLDHSLTAPFPFYVVTVMLLWISTASNWIIYALMNKQYLRGYRFLVFRFRLRMVHYNKNPLLKENLSLHHRIGYSVCKRKNLTVGDAECVGNLKHNTSSQLDSLSKNSNGRFDWNHSKRIG